MKNTTSLNDMLCEKKNIITPRDIVQTIIEGVLESECGETIIELAKYARANIDKIDKLYAFEKEMAFLSEILDCDQTKVTIEVAETGLTGFEIAEILEIDYSIKVELSDLNNIIFKVTEELKKDDIDKVINALSEIANTYRATNLAFCK